ncbi:hypothetical protein GCM10027592_29030 [Spirosoma flavus]
MSLAQDETQFVSPLDERYKFAAPVLVNVLEATPLRESTLQGASILATIPKGTQITITHRDRGHYRTKYGHKFGFVHFLYIDGDFKAFKAHTFEKSKDRSISLYEEEIDKDTVVYGYVNVERYLKEKPAYSAKNIYTIPEQTVLKLTPYNDMYWSTEVGGFSGYIGRAIVTFKGKTPEEAIAASKPVPESKTSSVESYGGYNWESPKRRTSVARTYSQYYIRGPRGGCYYLTASGRKQYVDRSLCN